MHQELILEKITGILEATEESYDEKLTAMLDEAARIFIAGAGRSKLVGNFFAMRLVHGGYNVNVVGEIVTPSIQEGDLLIVISGSGETEQLVAFTKSAKKIGAKIMHNQNQLLVIWQTVCSKLVVLICMAKWLGCQWGLYLNCQHCSFWNLLFLILFMRKVFLKRLCVQDTLI